MFKPGQLIKAVFSMSNKHCFLTEYLEEVKKPRASFCEFYQENRPNWTECPCIVSEVRHVAPQEYDHVADNLLKDYEWLEGKGGSIFEGFQHLFKDVPISEYRRVYLNLYHGPKEELERFKQSHRHLVVILEADGRDPIALAPSGYGYARDVGLFPAPLENDHVAH